MSQLLSIYNQQILESHKTPLRFYDELLIDRPPAAVWSYFSDLTQWKLWSPICRSCHLADRGKLQLGSILLIRFRILGLTIAVPARIIQFEPPELISWRGQRFGVDAIHTYRFLRRDDGTLMCNDETFSGLAFPLNRLITAWYRASKLSSQSLRGIKRELLERQQAVRQ